MSEQNVPIQNAVPSLVLGICSIIFGCFFVGLICGIICLCITNNSYRNYKKDPSMYSGGGMLVAGRILSIIGLVLGGIYVIYYLFVVLIAGSVALPFLNMLG